MRGRKGEYRRELAELQKRGFQRVKINGTFHEIEDAPALDKKFKHDIDVVVDRIAVRPDLATRLADSIETALRLADGIAIAEFADEVDGGAPRRITFSEKFACPVSGFTIAEIEPRLFSFNAPTGACPTCDGLGTTLTFEADLVVPDTAMTLNGGAVLPWARTGNTSPYYTQTLQAIAAHYEVDMMTPWRELPEKVRDVILYGSGREKIAFTYDDGLRSYTTKKTFEGVITNIERRWTETDSSWVRDELARYQSDAPCPACNGFRLKPEALAVKVGGRHIGEVSALAIRDAAPWFEALPDALTDQQREIARAILKEIRERLRFLVDVGLDYLQLSRGSRTLSGGESQRIRLASQIGSGLTGVLYVLDEPSIGLHQRDNARLIETLKRLRDLGNTVIVVEHDEDAILAADHVLDMGPGAGVRGGTVTAEGSPAALLANPASLTGQYLSGAREIPVPDKRRARKKGRTIKVVNATGNNLRGVTAEIPLGLFTAVTGVSGSGKSTLVIETLYRAVSRKLNKSREQPAPHEAITGLEHLDKIIDIDQSPIGRTPPLQPRHLHRRVHADPRLVRRAAGVQGARLWARPLLVQRQGWALRGVPRRRRHQDRDALPAGRLRHLRRVPRQALQPRDAGDRLQGTAPSPTSWR